MCKKLLVTLLLLFTLTFTILFANEADKPPIRRFGIFIGANNGGNERVRLRYAVTDARAMSHIFTSMGGIAGEDNIILVEPSIREINRQLDNLGRKVSLSKQNAQRTELIFYYSGHSDEDGIFLNRERYSYLNLRRRIDAVQPDMRIVILDSCSSGAMTRAKGGTKTQPFLFDTSVSTEGYAILTSGSVDEVSQESDSIESSYFTHSLLAGLRGAADSVGDGRVTLNELYRYAYTETMARTETSLFGTQHPSYDIQISGSGEVILTDIKEISASVIFAEDLTGRITIRDKSDFLVVELTKTANRVIEIGLESGEYGIILQQGNNFYRVDIILTENRSMTLRLSNFQQIAAESGSRRRGDNQELEDDLPIIPFDIQFIPGFNMVGNNTIRSTSIVLIGVFGAVGHNVSGFAASSFGTINTGNVNGFQGSGFFNIVNGNVNGFQGAGFFNITHGSVGGFQSAGFFNLTTGDISFFQAAGFFNIAGGKVNGLQAAGFFNYAEEINGLQAAGFLNINKGGSGVMLGLINISDSENVVPIGLINIVKNGIFHPAIYIDDLLFTNLILRSGEKYFYALLGAGTRIDYLYNDESKYLVTRGGFGFEIPVYKAFINIDVTAGSIINLSREREDYSDFSTQVYQARLSAGYKILEHLGIFAGISYDFFMRWEDSPDPRNFGGLIVGDERVSGEIGRHYHKLGFFGGVQF